MTLRVPPGAASHVSLPCRHRSAPGWRGSVHRMGDALGNLHRLVLAALFLGADNAQEIAARLGLDVDDVALLLAELEEAGALTVVTEP